MNIVSFALTKKNERADNDRLAYNLFRRRNEPDLYCAVPEDHPVPSFISGEAWDFGGTLDSPVTTLRGFDPQAARHGVRLTGYYLFLADVGDRPARLRDGDLKERLA